MRRKLLVLLTIVFQLLNIIDCDINSDAIAFLHYFNRTAEQHYYDDNEANWIYQSNVTDHNAQLAAEADADFNQFLIQQAANASRFNEKYVRDYGNRRQLKFIRTVGINLTTSDQVQLSNMINQMIDINQRKICAYRENCTIPTWSLDPDITNRLATSRDYEELEYIWTAWRQNAAQIRPIYQQFVALSNKGARQGGFKDTGDYWRSWYETDQFEHILDNAFKQVLPLYEELHTYVRRKLMQKYPNRFNTSAVPAHLFGNMWAQEWENIVDFTMPFPNKQSVDVTAQMNAQNYRPLRMFQTAEAFFQSLGLPPMDAKFWKKSILTKPTDRTIVCHASAWDFYTRDDYRIKMCTQVNMSDLITIHHEMGHIQYYQHYADQPVPFRNGANPGFHEAIGDTIALSASTPAHLQKIGLLFNYTSDPQQDLNYLFSQAMSKVAFLPFGYMIDLYRWNVFNGTFGPDQYNTGWWQLRTRYQGIVPPNHRPINYFDAASKSHVADNTPYIRYFFSFIAQFQFYKSMCKASGHTDALYKCDFYRSRPAGDLLGRMLKLGNSVPWPNAMRQMTGAIVLILPSISLSVGQDSLDASAILEYFDPLRKWLHTENMRANDCFGWGETWPTSYNEYLSCPRCSATLGGRTMSTLRCPSIHKFCQNLTILSSFSVDSMATTISTSTSSHQQKSSSICQLITGLISIFLLVQLLQ